MFSAFALPVYPATVIIGWMKDEQEAILEHGLQKSFFLRSKFWKKNEKFSFVFQILKIHILRGQLE